MLLKKVSVFSNAPNSGNPAGVYVVDEFPEEKKMLLLSKEINFSETAFVKQISDAKYQIRWFTTVSEAPICIHATIASAHVLYEENLQNSNIEFLSHSYSFLAYKENDWITLVSPKIPIYNFDNIDLPQDLLKNCKPVYIGLSQNILFVELSSSAEVRNFIPNLEIIKKLPIRALLITSSDKKYDFISRYFAPSVGINEDPVCGSAHCRLIPYWAKKLNKNELLSYQASFRGGIIKCKNLDNSVLISGETITLK